VSKKGRGGREEGGVAFESIVVGSSPGNGLAEGKGSFQKERVEAYLEKLYQECQAKTEGRGSIDKMNVTMEILTGDNALKREKEREGKGGEHGGLTSIERKNAKWWWGAGNREKDDRRRREKRGRWARSGGE